MKLAQLQEARYAGTANERMWWDFVDAAQWTKDFDYRRIEDMLRRTDPKIAKELEEIYRKLQHDLYLYLDDKVKGVSDDGFSDLLAHIVGSGEKVYNQVMNDWKVAQGIIRNREYREGFQYIWHYQYDD